MDAIVANALTKDYVVSQPRQGFLGALRDLVQPRRVIKRALDRVDFAIPEGQAVAYLGPNGAGKSTTIKLLTGILTPTAGSVQVNGIDPGAERIKNAARVGAVFGHRTQLWWDLPLAESFDLLRAVYRVPYTTFRQQRDRFYEMLELGQFDRTPVRQLSLGQRMRAEIAAAFLHGPRVVYLDEPTVGLDVVAKERIRTFLRTIRETGDVTLILITHDLVDVEQVCERIILIDKARVTYDGSLDRFRQQVGGYRTLMVQFETPVAAADLAWLPVQKVEGSKAWLRIDQGGSASRVVAEISAALPVVDISLEEPSIEELVRNVYQHGLRAAI